MESLGLGSCACAGRAWLRRRSTALLLGEKMTSLGSRTRWLSVGGLCRLCGICVCAIVGYLCRLCGICACVIVGDLCGHVADKDLWGRGRSARQQRTFHRVRHHCLQCPTRPWTHKSDGGREEVVQQVGPGGHYSQSCTNTTIPRRTAHTVYGTRTWVSGQSWSPEGGRGRHRRRHNPAGC